MMNAVYALLALALVTNAVVAVAAIGEDFQPGFRRWVVEPRRIRPVIRRLERTVDPLFRQAGVRLP